MKAISSLKRLGAYIKPYKVQFILVLLFTVATVGFNAAMPYVSGLPTTEISRNIAAGEGVNFDYVILCLIWIAVVGVGYCFSQLMSGLLITNVVQSAMRDLRQDIEEKINRLPVSYFDRNQQGNILSRVTNDVDAVSGAMQQALIGIVNAFLGIVMAVSMMFYINTYMALVSLIMIPASLLISRTIVKKSQKDFQGMQNALGDLNGYVQENMTGFSVLKVYGREKQTPEGFKRIDDAAGANDRLLYLYRNGSHGELLCDQRRDRCWSAASVHSIHLASQSANGEHYPAVFRLAKCLSSSKTGL